MSADVSELIAFRDKLEGIQRQKDVIVSAIAKELTARLLRKVKKRTPVKTGTLRRGWTTGNTYNGDSYVVVMVNNNTYYASYVENGHRKRNKKGWVHGRKMLALSVEELQKDSQAIIERKVQKWLEGAVR